MIHTVCAALVRLGFLHARPQHGALVDYEAAVGDPIEVVFRGASDEIASADGHAIGCIISIVLSLKLAVGPAGGLPGGGSCGGHGGGADGGDFRSAFLAGVRNRCCVHSQ